MSGRMKTNFAVGQTEVGYLAPVQFMEPLFMGPEGQSQGLVLPAVTFGVVSLLLGSKKTTVSSQDPWPVWTCYNHVL